MERPIRVLMVDDHPLFRQGVKFFIGGLDQFDLVAERRNLSGTRQTCVSPAYFLTCLLRPKQSPSELQNKAGEYQEKALPGVKNAFSNLNPTSIW